MRVGVLVLALGLGWAGCKKGDPPGAPAAGGGLDEARLTEAKVGLMKLAKAAQVYYATPMVDRQGRKLDCQFPASVGWSHDALPCGLPGQQYAAEPQRWSVATWTALAFAMSDAHRFRYKVDSSGTLAAARFTATAEGDPDCDGTPEVFTIQVEGDPNATHAECAAKTDGTPVQVRR